MGSCLLCTARPEFAEALREAVELADEVAIRNRDGLGVLKTKRAEDRMKAERERQKRSGKIVDSEMISIDLENANIGDILDVIERNKDKYRFRDFSKLRSESDFLGIVGRVTAGVTGRSLLSFQKQPITNSLCRFSAENVSKMNEAADGIDLATGHTLDHKQLTRLSIDIFSKILKFQNVDGMKSTISEKVESARWIIRNGKEQIAVRDEIFAQILKQITLCPTAKSRELGWKLLFLCIASFSAASGEMAHILLSTICSKAQHIERLDTFRNVHETATNCFKAWRALNGVPRGFKANASIHKTGYLFPSEMRAVIQSKTELLRLEIFLFDDTRLRLKVEPLWKLKALTLRVCDKLGLLQWAHDFTLRITTNEDGMDLMDDLNEEALSGDVQVKHWYERWRDIKRVRPVLRFKVNLFKWRYRWKWDSVIALKRKWSDRKRYIHVVYSQYVAMVEDGSVPVGRDDYCVLGAIQLLIEFRGKEITQKWTSQQITKLVPYRMRANDVEFEEVRDQIHDHLEAVGAAVRKRKIKGNAEEVEFRRVMVLELRYIQYLAEHSETYGVTQFRVRIVEPMEQRFQGNEGMVMAVGMNKVFLRRNQRIANDDEADILENFDFRKIEGLTRVPESNQLTFHIAVGGEQPLRYRIESKMIDALNSLLRERVAQRDAT